MPVVCNLPAIPVRVTLNETDTTVEWDWNGGTFQRCYGYSGDTPAELANRSQIARMEANEFAEALRSLHRLNSGPAVMRLTDSDLAERERVRLLRRELLSQYLDMLATGETGAKAIAAELGIPEGRTREDSNMLRQYVRCREQSGRLRECQDALANFHASLSEDDKMDLHTRPSLMARHTEFRRDVQSCRDFARGMRDIQTKRPDWFDGDRLIVDVETVAG